MRRFNFILLAALIALLTACQPIVGKLTVARSLEVELTEQNRSAAGGCLVRDGGCGDPMVQPISASFHPGVYDARLDIDDSDAMELRVDDGTDSKAAIKISIPEDTRLPSKSGSFMLTSNESGQPFQVKGTVQAIESSSPVTAGWEQCDLTVRQHVCTYVKKKGDNSKQRWCRYEYRTVYGQRPVEFHHVLKTREVFLDFDAEGTGEKVAEFNGSASRNYKVYDYRGHCDADNIFVHRSVW